MMIVAKFGDLAEPETRVKAVRVLTVTVDSPSEMEVQ